VLDLLGMGSSEEDQHRAAPDSVSTPPSAPVVLPDLMDGWDASEIPDMPQVFSGTILVGVYFVRLFCK